MIAESRSSLVRVEVSKDRIIKDLRKIGVTEGDHVAVALSFKSIGYVRGGPEAFIDALLEVVGSDGTIMMNTYTHSFCISEVPSDYVFDYKSTPAYTGLVPETLRRRRNSIRSRHPTCSVTAIGRLARYLTESHDETSGAHMPYSRLAEVDGKYLCIGLGNNLVAIRHECQRLAGLFSVVPIVHGVKYVDDEGKVKIFVFDYPPCIKKLPELVPILRKRGIVRIGRIGMAYSVLSSARELIEAMTGMLRKNPTLNLCNDIFCLWCRELERRINLYGKIENPRYFQKSLFMIKALALVNQVRLKKFRFLSFRSGNGNEIKEKKRLKGILILLGSSRKILVTFFGLFSKFYTKDLVANLLKNT